MIEIFIALMGATTLAGAIITASAVLGVLGGLFLGIRKGYRKVKSVTDKGNAIYDSIVGAPAIVDPETGAVLKDATLSMGARVATIEHWQSETVKVLQTLADNQQAIVDIKKDHEAFIKSMALRDEQGKAIIEEWTKWREEFKASKQDEHDRIWKAIEDMDKRLP